MRKFLPSTIDIAITGRCNMNCLVCFGPRRHLRDCDINKLTALIRILPEYGVKSVVITGGEPLLVDRLAEVLKVAKSAGLVVVLSTNGISLRDKLETVGPFVDWVGLPLDGDSPDSHAKMRGGDTLHFTTTLSLIREIRRSYAMVRIKIGTVVGRWNKDSICGIFSVMRRRIYKPDVWKLYQAVCNEMEEMTLDVHEFDEIVNKARILAQRNGINCEVLYAHERDGKYLFLDPEGEAVVISNGKEQCIGNFFLDIAGVVSSWHQFVDIERLEGNFRSTYPLV
ncbi:MAG: Sporulation killing factor maturation protein SkfB [Syntrophomonadaceae bacterium]|nr:Sporulation killing factor maturation protein SkfB [Bacillota bacterium]